MKTIRNNRDYNDLKVIEIKSNSTINFEEIGDNVDRIQTPPKPCGFFDIIKNNFLFLFCKDNKIFLGVDQSFHPINLTKIYYLINNQDRFLSIEFPTGIKIEINYHFRDLIKDPVLLLGSYEENEDYDFGCWLYNIRNSHERQIIVLENNE